MTDEEAKDEDLYDKQYALEEYVFEASSEESEDAESEKEDDRNQIDRTRKAPEFPSCLLKLIPKIAIPKYEYPYQPKECPPPPTTAVAEKPE